jgi:hypothetical protein
MEAFQEELLKVLAAKEPALTDHIVDQDVMPVPSGMTFSREELRQMVSGFWALIREGIAGQSRELREMYISSVFPGLRDSGTPAAAMVAGSARTLFHVTGELLDGLDPSHRDPARRFLIDYFSDYLGDMAGVWESAK